MALRITPTPLFNKPSSKLEIPDLLAPCTGIRIILSINELLFLQNRT